jgi:hypothetical protein
VRLPPREWATTLHVVLVMTFVELLVRQVRLERLVTLLGFRVDFTPAQVGARKLPLRELPVRARRQVRCTRRVAGAWPFSNGPCLRRALVLGHLLRSRSPAVRIGIAGSGDSLLAHAWLEVAGRPLEDVDGYALLHRSDIRAAG